MSTQQAFEQDLDKVREDWELRSIYADWLEEQGMILTANSQRWQAKHKKRPMEKRLSHFWLWFPAIPRYWGHDEESNLPSDIYDLLQQGTKLAHDEDHLGYTGPLRFYDSWQAAEEDLANALWELKYGRKPEGS